MSPVFCPRLQPLPSMLRCLCCVFALPLLQRVPRQNPAVYQKSALTSLTGMILSVTSWVTLGRLPSLSELKLNQPVSASS